MFYWLLNWFSYINEKDTPELIKIKSLKKGKRSIFVLNNKANNNFQALNCQEKSLKYYKNTFNKQFEIFEKLC